MHRNLLHTVCVALIAILWFTARPSVAVEPAQAAARKSRAGNRLAYLEENNPWYPHREFPRLITPQWVGEEGVDCVIVLAIDDMREPAKYEAFLRPILDRLKKIDGRAPVSIMTCNVKPDDPQLAQWLAEGLSLEVHTLDHPCPLLQGGDFAKAKATYDRCVDLMNDIPGNQPVAFRMPCCDSLNTVSPRFYAEIFSTTTAKGNSLKISSSVFNLFTPNDLDIPRELVFDPDGRDKFRKYLPRGLVRDGMAFDTFVNYIEDYPYPYVVDRNCWEFPCVVPSDWSAQHLQQSNNPDTIRDLKAALDITVLKKGVYNLVFHPHGWIKAEQVVEIIDHAVAKHGKRVKFMTFREAYHRLDRNLLNRTGVGSKGFESGYRILDIDNDGYMDVIRGGPLGPGGRQIAGATPLETEIWTPDKRESRTIELPMVLASTTVGDATHLVPRIGTLDQSGRATFLLDDLRVVRTSPKSSPSAGFWFFKDDKWVLDPSFIRGLERENAPAIPTGGDGTRLRDIDGDGICELFIGSSAAVAIYRFDALEKTWRKLPFGLPAGTALWANQLAPGPLVPGSGLRFVDIDEDGCDDIVFSNAERFGVYLFNDMQTGWSRIAVARGRREPVATSSAPFDLPPIVRADGGDNGYFVHSRYLFWQNEDTAKLPDLVDRRSFNEILAQADLPPKAKSPKASLDSIRVRPGFKVELLAAEPLVLDPISFAFGADGKLWVVEMGDYPLGAKEEPLQRAGGQIRYIEDTDGDGRYDKATVFLDVPFPTGVLPWRNGILVTAAPDILYVEDTDGDGRADRREVLYTGFVEGNQQHRVNSLVWGLDNWIYVANGDSGGMIESKKTGKKVSINGRDLRIEPDTGDLDAVTGQTQFGRSRDDWGNWFGCNNSNPLYQFVLDDASQRRNPHFSATAPRVDVPEVAGNAPVYPVSQLQSRFNDFHTANHFTSACSAMIYRDDLFGPHFAGNAFICEPVHNLVHREVVSPTGLLFTSHRAVDEEQSEFLASSDNWFRPTTVKTGPDGALWISDMYRHVIEHPQWIPDTWQKKLDLRAGHDKGRIYRVYPVDKQPRTFPRLDKLDTAGLVAALDSPSGWQRDVAQQLLVIGREPAAVPLLKKAAIEGKNPLYRLHALCSLSGFGPVSEQVLVEAIDDIHPGVRRQAIRLAGMLRGELSRVLLGALKNRCLAPDCDPHEQMQLAYTLGEIDEPEAAALLGQLLSTASDNQFIRSALFSSVNDKNIVQVLTTVLRETGQTGANAAVIGDLMDVSAAFGNDQAVATLVKFVVVRDGDRPQPWKFIALARLLNSLARRSESLVDKLQAAKGADVEQLMVGVERLFETARKVAANENYKPDVRVWAVPLLGRQAARQEADFDLLGSLLTPQSPIEVQDAALRTLGGLHHSRVPGLLLDHWKGFGPSRRSQVLDILLSRDAWAEQLLAAIAEESVARTDVDAARRQRLLEHRSPDVRQKAVKAFAAQVNADRQKVIGQYQMAHTDPGDPVRGAKRFEKACALCHKLAGVGFEVGPDLTSLTNNSSEALLVAILDPNRAVESKFLTYVAQTKSGTTLSGMLASETGNGITLRGPEGKEQTILRSELEELVGTSKSMMPEGLEKDLPPQDLADIIAFVRLNVPLPKRKQMVGNEPRSVAPGAEGSLILSAADCEIYGSTLLFEPQYQNLGYWSSLDDHAVWNLEAVGPGKYAVEFNWACDASVAGNLWQLEATGGNLTGEVESTSDWNTYRQEKVGEITLAAGEHRIVLRPRKKPQGALMDLKTIRLVPLK